MTRKISTPSRPVLRVYSWAPKGDGYQEWVAMPMNNPPRFKCGRCLRGVVLRMKGKTGEWVQEQCKVCGAKSGVDYLGGWD